MSVNDMSEEEFDTYYNGLVKTVEPSRKYYDIDKVKTYGVWVWNKEDEEEKQWNVFDIYSDEIVMYDEEHVIIEEAKPIIAKIQEKLKEFDKYLDKEK